MVKTTVTRKTKAKVIKKVKKVNTGAPIIKQKVIVNVDKAAPRRRGRPRGSFKKEPINKPQSTPVIQQYPFYDQMRASAPYFEELKSDLHRLRTDNESTTKHLLGMQQQALLLQMQNQQQQNQPPQQQQQIEDNYYATNTYEELPDEALDIEQKRLEAMLEAKRFQAEKNALIKANKQAGVAKAREAKAKLNEQRMMMEQEDVSGRIYRATMRENDKAVDEAKKEALGNKKAMAKTLAEAVTTELAQRQAAKEANDKNAIIAAAKLAAKTERAAKKAAKQEAERQRLEAERLKLEAEKAAKQLTPKKKGRKPKNK